MKEANVKKAVALRFDKEKEKAPRVVAKGKSLVAERIIKIAKENELPIKKDEDLVELLTKIELDKEIPSNLYKAVAEVFSFIYNVTNKKL
ncbi:EscU/YscU/HrcU family type III secretion system export apparatus switch protein [Sulfurospirillum arcachonense]|uniref:EscU/YscU/HrcU family type III secretion system export apparatus switch protein n=1 Tax=Sulfurospirillum arcachonense TaxID=57666 RepID=UPI00046AF4A8|nr:EscU/YscU/HrcU family type III secretion system export apparatus switch protein [Sulfurospirillum arcachonense]